MEVGVRELKQHLSKYLDQVESGVELLVTDRGKPKARIVPVTEAGHLQLGIDEGWIRPAQRSVAIGTGTRHRSRRRIADVLDEDRA
jgi:prevent-host-death family protein